MARVEKGDLCREPECPRPRVTRDGLCKTHYNKSRGYSFDSVQKDPERERARLRLKTHRRKDWSRLTDITPEYEMALRAKVKRCPLCDVRLTDEPYLPHSKELDHIIPRGVGGTHTMGNVRIICRACNIARPKDGSDYTGPVTLWAQDPVALARVRSKAKARNRCDRCGGAVRSGRCWTCRPAIVRGGLTLVASRQRRALAATMRREGIKWCDIAAELGYGSPGAAYLAVAAHHKAAGSAA